MKRGQLWKISSLGLIMYMYVENMGLVSHQQQEIKFKWRPAEANFNTQKGEEEERKKVSLR